MVNRIYLPAHTAFGNLLHPFSHNRFRLNSNTLNAQNIFSDFPELFQQEFLVAFLIALELKNPGFQFGAGFDFFQVDANANTFSAALFVKGNGKAAKWENSEPAIADSTIGEDLH